MWVRFPPLPQWRIGKYRFVMLMTKHLRKTAKVRFSYSLQKMEVLSNWLALQTLNLVSLERVGSNPITSSIKKKTRWPNG